MGNGDLCRLLERLVNNAIALRQSKQRSQLFFAGISIDPNEGMEALRKIDKAAVFVGDVTIIGRAGPKERPTSNPNVVAELGYALHLKEDLAGAIAAYREAVRLDPTAAQTHYNLGLALQEWGDLAGAIGAFEVARRLDPNDPDKVEALRTALLMRDGRIAPPPREVKR